MQLSGRRRDPALERPVARRREDHLARRIYEKAANAFVEAQDRGTPQQILEKIERRRQALGDIDVSSSFSDGGMPFADVEQNMRTFAKKALPEVHSWQRPRERRAEPERVAA